MTINDAIKQLTELRERVGGLVPVYTDCERCGESTTPTVIVVVETHLKVKIS